MDGKRTIIIDMLHCGSHFGFLISTVN